MAEADDFEKQRWRDMERQWQDNRADFAYFNGAQERFAAACIKSLELTAAGGIFATLGFYSANYARLTERAGSLDTFNRILVLLFVALFLALLTAAAAYFSQLGYAEAINNRKTQNVAPYVLITPASTRWTLAGNILRFVGMGFGFTSLGFLTAAGLHIVRLFQ